MGRYPAAATALQRVNLREHDAEAPPAANTKKICRTFLHNWTHRLQQPLPQCLVWSVLVVLLLKPLETFLRLFPDNESALTHLGVNLTPVHYLLSLLSLKE